MKGEKRTRQVWGGSPTRAWAWSGAAGKSEVRAGRQQGCSAGISKTSSSWTLPRPPTRHRRHPEELARGRVGSKACFDRGEKREREREALTRTGMCWTGCRRTFAWPPRLPPSWTAEHGLSAGPPIWSGDDMNEIKRNTPNRRNRSCWGRNRDTHPQRRSEEACRSGLWIKADGHGLLCAVFSCSLGSRLFLALWGSVRGFKWPYKTTVRLTLPPPHRKQAQGEMRWHSPPLKCYASRSEAGVEEDPGPPGAGSVSSSALPGGRRVQQCYRSGATSCKGFPPVGGQKLLGWGKGRTG